MRLNFRPLVLASLLALGAWPAFGKDEIDAPAGDLPQGDDPGAVPAEQDGPVLDDTGNDKKAGAKKDKKADPDAISQPAWDSYDDKGGGAEEITRGVRVEDIIEPPSDYRYAAFGKGDPFVPPLITEEDKIVNPLEIPIVSPLQRYKLDQLSLVGIWQVTSGERKAMIMTPGGGGGGNTQGIIVKNGDPIGQKGGRILGIGDDYLTVREFTLGPDGTRQYQDEQMFMGRRAFEDQDGKIHFDPGGKEPQVIIQGGEAEGGGGKAAAAGGAGAEDVVDGKAANAAGLKKDKVAAAVGNAAPAKAAAANAAPPAAAPAAIPAAPVAAAPAAAAPAAIPAAAPAAKDPAPVGAKTF